MTTKEQERKALAQIRKIVDGLGDGSYIGMAFEGCFEDAETNIENDWGCSMKQRAESAEREALKWSQKADSLSERLALVMSDRDEAAKRSKELEGKVSYHLATINAMEKEAQATQEKTDHAINELSDKLIEKAKELEAAQLEIIRLKARLFDLIDNQ